MNTTAPRRTVVPTAQVPVEDLPLATPMPDTTHRQVEVFKPEVKLYSASIAKALLAVTRALSPVAKAGTNTFHKYAYPKWEDVLEELGPKLAEHGLIVIQSEVAHGGFASDLIEVTYEFTIIHENGDIWPDRPRWTAICKVRDSKGVLDDKAASKCHTQAEKYALMKLFKIRTRDMGAEDHDNDAPNQQTTGKRIVPTASGKLPPHEIVTIEGDSAASWATRFLEKIKAADSDDEIGQWDVANGHHLDRLQQKAVDTYNKVVLAMDERRAEIAKGKPVQAAGPEPTQQAKAQPAKPKRVRPSRAKPKPDQAPASEQQPAAEQTQPEPEVEEKPKLILTDDERDWLHGLGGAFSGCEDKESLDIEGERLMDPWQGKVSDDAWQAAVDLYQEHVERLTPESGVA